MDNFDGYIAEIYKEMEQELIASMQRNLGLHLAEEKKAGFKYPQWQAEKLKELKRFQRENERIIGAKVSGLPGAVRDQMIEELNQGSVHELKRYREALKKGYKPAKLMKDSFFKVNDNKVTAMIDALNNDLQRANTAVLRMINDQYRQTIFKAGVFVSNGVYTEEKAVDKAIQEFVAKGLNCIEYRDGRRVNIADYASMAVRTANQRAYMVGEGEFRKEIGETLVIISRHSTSCELCKPFEGKVLIDDVYSGGSQEDGDYMLLSEAMEQGLYHPRCRHGLGTYYPELEEKNGYETENNKLNDYKSNDSGVAKSEKSDIIKPKQMLRKRANKGAFSGLTERMSKKRIRKLAKEFDIDLTGISLNIDFNEELLRLPYTGRADSESVGGITFFPNAFRDKETLLRTLYHELQHVKQFKEFGTEYVQNNLGAFEKMAYEAEDAFIESLRKEGKL